MDSYPVHRNSTLRSWVVAILALLTAGLLLSACGDDSTASGVAANQPGTSVVKDHPDEVPPTSVEFRPVLSVSQPGSSVTSLGGSGSSGTDTSDSPEPVGPEGGLAASDSRSGARYLLGPVFIDSSNIQSATATESPEGRWDVNLVLRDGADGIDKFNAMARLCFDMAPQCPDVGGGHGQVAIVVNGDVISAPTINTANFQRDQISIGGVSDGKAAKELARAMTTT